MKRSRILPAVGLLLMAAPMFARPEYAKPFIDHYKPAAGTALATAGCKICHIGFTKELNPYGKDLKKTMAALKEKKLSAASVKKANGLDSDKDGVKNGVELKAGTLPGDPSSKPAKK